jgi:uncharacterized membrane protein
MSVEEIRSSINGQSRLTFDYLVMVAAAALIAGVGIITDSSVTVVASMLVSPLMGPILCAAFGIAVCRWDMVWRGVRNELYGVRIILAFCTQNYWNCMNPWPLPVYAISCIEPHRSLCASALAF